MNKGITWVEEMRSVCPLDEAKEVKEKMHERRKNEVSLFGGKGLEIFQGKHKVLNR